MREREFEPNNDEPQEGNDWHNFLRSFDKLADDFREVYANNRNFRVIMSKLNKDNTLDHLELIDESGKVFDIAGDLPEGYKLRIGEKFLCDHKFKHVIYDIQELNMRGGLLSLFHEIGHAKYPAEKKSTFDPKFVLAAISITVNLFKKRKAIIEEMKEHKGNPQMQETARKLIVRDAWPDWYKYDHAKKTSLNERRAWAYALLKMRNLEKQGLNVFDGFKDFSEIQKYINICLISYDISYFNSLDNDERAKLEIFPHSKVEFNKKS